MDPMLVEKDTGRFLLERAIVPQKQVDMLLYQFHFFPMVGSRASSLRSGQKQACFQMRAEPASAMYGTVPMWMHASSTHYVRSLPYSTLQRQEDYVFQVRKEEDGRLDLSQVTLLDRTTGQKSPAHLLSALPERPLHFFDLPWQSEFLGNVLQDEPPQTWTWAWYLVAQRGPSRRDGLDLECVYRLDGCDGTVERCDVLRVAPPETPESDLILRIKR